MTDQNALKYTAEHEWVLVDGDTATVGITAYAADKLGDVVYVELPQSGAVVAGGAVVEAATPLYIDVRGTRIAASVVELPFYKRDK